MSLWLPLLAVLGALLFCAFNHPAYYKLGYLGLLILLGVAVSVLSRQFGQTLDGILARLAYVVVVLAAASSVRGYYRFGYMMLAMGGFAAACFPDSWEAGTTTKAVWTMIIAAQLVMLVMSLRWKTLWESSEPFKPAIVERWRCRMLHISEGPWREVPASPAPTVGAVTNQPPQPATPAPSTSTIGAAMAEQPVARKRTRKPRVVEDSAPPIHEPSMVSVNNTD